MWHSVRSINKGPKTNFQTFPGPWLSLNSFGQITPWHYTEKTGMFCWNRLFPKKIQLRIPCIPNTVQGWVKRIPENRKLVQVHLTQNQVHTSHVTTLLRRKPFWANGSAICTRKRIIGDKSWLGVVGTGRGRRSSSPITKKIVLVNYLTIVVIDSGFQWRRCDESN